MNKPNRSSVSSQLPSPPPSPDHQDIELRQVLGTKPNYQPPLSSTSLDPTPALTYSADPTQLFTHHTKPVPYDEGQWSTILKSSGNLSNDPFLLRSRLQDESALGKLRKRGRKAKPVGDFYETQNEHIVSLLSFC